MKKYLLPSDTVKEKCAVALGDFDGLHKAHRKLIKKAVEIAKSENISSGVYVFDKSIKSANVITPEGLKERLIEQEDADFIAVQHADKEFFDTSCEDFVEKILKDKLNAKYVIVGENYTFGKKGKGTSAYLKELCRKADIETVIVDDVLFEGEIISSSRIRKLLAEGEIEKVNSILGYNYIIEGIVQHGKQLGRTLGFPTANVYPEENTALPKFGVYLAEVKIKGKSLKAIVNVGVRPTVNGVKPSVEAYIKGIDGEFYGEKIEISFLEFIRGEQKFASVDELKKQIEEDAKSGGVL